MLDADVVGHDRSQGAQVRGAQDEVTGGAVRTVTANGTLRWPVVAVAFVAVSVALSTLLALTSIYQRRDTVRTLPAGSGLARRVVPGRLRVVPEHRQHRLFLRPRACSRRSRSSRCTPWACAAVGGALGDLQVAGSLIGVLAGLAAVLLFARWVWTAAAAPVGRAGHHRPAGLPVLVLPLRRHVRRLAVPALRDQRVRPARASVVPRRGPGRRPGHGREAGRDRRRGRARRPHARDARGGPPSVVAGTDGAVAADDRADDADSAESAGPSRRHGRGRRLA